MNDELHAMYSEYRELAREFSRWHTAKHGRAHIEQLTVIAFDWSIECQLSWMRLWADADEERRSFMIESVPTE